MVFSVFVNKRAADECQPLLSVVVPMYNVEGFIAECIKSLKAQTLSDVEFVLVDDGSTDTTVTCARTAIADDARFEILTTKHRGPSSARNHGIRHAHGRYLTFADADDIVPESAYAFMINTLERTGSDLATGNTIRFDGTRTWNTWNHKHSHARGAADAITLRDRPELLFDTQAWNKMFRRTYFDRQNLKFPTGKLYEDMVPTLTAFANANAIDIVDEIVYHWRYRPQQDSITQRRHESENLHDKLLMLDKSFKILAKIGNRKLINVYRYKALQGDLWFYVDALGAAPAPFQRAFAKAAKKIWDASAESVRHELSDKKRFFYTLLDCRGAAAAVAGLAWWNEHSEDFPVAMHDDVPAIDLLDVFGASGQMSEQTSGRHFPLNTLITLKLGLLDVTLEPNTCELHGWMQLAHVPPAAITLQASIGPLGHPLVVDAVLTPYCTGKRTTFAFSIKFAPALLTNSGTESRDWPVRFVATAGTISRNADETSLTAIPWLLHAQAVPIDHERELVAIAKTPHELVLRRRRRSVEVERAQCVNGDSRDLIQVSAIPTHVPRNISEDEALAQRLLLTADVTPKQTLSTRVPLTIEYSKDVSLKVRPGATFQETVEWPHMVERNAFQNLAVADHADDAVIAQLHAERSGHEEPRPRHLKLAFINASVAGCDALGLLTAQDDLVPIAAIDGSPCDAAIATIDLDAPRPALTAGGRLQFVVFATADLRKCRPVTMSASAYATLLDIWSPALPIWQSENAHATPRDRPLHKAPTLLFYATRVRRFRVRRIA